MTHYVGGGLSLHRTRAGVQPEPGSVPRPPELQGVLSVLPQRTAGAQGGVTRRWMQVPFWGGVHPSLSSASLRLVPTEG